jgi:MYXO-CTERM domain-containing protein
MVTNHTERLGGNLAIWDAQPWGPWSLVLKDDHWPDGDDVPVSPSFTFGGFGPKWFSADGHHAVFVWFRPDRWNSVALEIVPEDPPPVPGPGSPGIAALALFLLAAAGAGLRRR